MSMRRLAGLILGLLAMYVPVFTGTPTANGLFLYWTLVSLAMLAFAWIETGEVRTE